MSNTKTEWLIDELDGINPNWRDEYPTLLAAARHYGLDDDLSQEEWDEVDGYEELDLTKVMPYDPYLDPDADDLDEFDLDEEDTY